MKTSLLQNIQTLMNQILEVRYSDLEKEREACQALLEISERENHLYGIAFAHTYLGDYYIAQNDSSKCGEHLQIARPVCVENAFSDLLLRIYNLYGICYESLADEQTALQYYLMALNLSEKNHNPSIECILYNNIANNFENFKDYEEAEKYYVRAAALFTQIPPDFPNQRYIQLRIWGNLTEVYRVLGKYEKMAEYLSYCKTMRGKDCGYTRTIILCRGWCGYYADNGNLEKAEAYAHLLLNCAVANPLADKYLTYEMLIGVCTTMINSGRSVIAKLHLDHILKMLHDSEVDRLQQIQKLKTQYYEAFGTEQERLLSYQEYYQTMDHIGNNLYQVRASGLRNILYLDQLKNNLVQEKDSLDEEAHLDELTKLYNRRHFNKMISKSFSDSDISTLGFIMIDVDYFKEYNDTYGHAKGDIALQTVAAILSENAINNIMTSRYGGDEFACLCVNTTDEEIEAFLKAVQNDLKARPLEHSASHCASSVTLSIGYSNGIKATITSSDLLLDEADQALYTSKNSGRNRFTKFLKPEA